MIFLALLLVLSTLEFNGAPLFAMIDAAGLIVGLALQNTLSNFASGLVILLYRPFDLGDSSVNITFYPWVKTVDYWPRIGICLSK